MSTPRTGLRWVGRPSFSDASATSGMWANLMVASNSMNATGIPVSTRPDQRVADPLRAKVGVSSVASIVVSWFVGCWTAPTSRRQTRPPEIDIDPSVLQATAMTGEFCEGARHLVRKESSTVPDTFDRDTFDRTRSIDGDRKVQGTSPGLSVFGGTTRRQEEPSVLRPRR